jgi:DnaK suppressor protein
MTTEQAKQRLQAHEQELLGNMRRLGEDARESQMTDVQDPIDYVESSENKALNFRVDTIASNELRQVQDALQRIEDGSYGKCIDCGRPINEARLQAVPWTPYCLADQEKHDQEAASPDESPRIASE